jgi:hypothetical protein
MVRQRRLCLAILIYVAADLSFTAVPGAFVFDPSVSVEMGRGRVETEIAPDAATAPAPAESPAAAWPHLAAARAVAPAARPVVSVLPRAALSLARAPAPVSEDPH